MKYIVNLESPIVPNGVVQAKFEATEEECATLVKILNCAVWPHNFRLNVFRDLTPEGKCPTS